MSGANANWTFWSAASSRRAASSASSTSWPSRAWASRVCCTSSANASARTEPSSCREAARLTVSRRRSCPSSRSCAARFSISAGEAEKEIAQKLEMGLTVLGLHSVRKPWPAAQPARPQSPARGARGLDGVLIGLRTRELLQQLAGSALPPLAGGPGDRGLALDRQRVGRSAGQDRRQRRPSCGFCSSIRADRNTSRPGSTAPTVTKLRLEPLPAGDIRRLGPGAARG